MMWTQAAVLQYAPRKTILNGLSQSVFHLREAGLDVTSPGQSLVFLFEQAQETSDGDWTESLRSTYARKLHEIKGTLGFLVRAQQEGFRRGPWDRPT
jgi:hypothetical protein